MSELFISNYSQALSNHTAILQTLNRVIGDVIFPVNPFLEAAQKWDGMPIVYANDHPDMDALTANPIAELQRIGGREVGLVRNPRIEPAGHPRLMADMVINDPEVDAGIESGEISLSTGFYAADDGFQITGLVTPNHVLVFKETLLEQPKDQGSGFLNHTSNHQYYNKTTIKTMRGTMADKNDDNQILTADEIKNLAKMDTATHLQKVTEYENKLKAAEAIANDRYETIKDMEAKIEKFVQMERDRNWDFIMPKLPKGWTTGEELTKTREQLNKKPEMFVSNLIDHYEKLIELKLDAQGKQFLNNVNIRNQKQKTALCSGIFLNGEEI